MISDVRQVAVQNPDYPKVVLVYQGGPHVGQAFFKDRWPEVAAVADPEMALYDAFGLRRGNLYELAGPGVVFGAMRATLKGHSQGRRPTGDPTMLPGAFLIKSGEVVWTHRFAHAADAPNWAEIK